MSASDETSGIKRPLRDGIDTVKTQASDVAHIALDKTRDGLGHARESLGHARESVADAYDTGLERAADAYATGRERAAETLASAREKLRDATADAVDAIEANPLIAVAGGIALGVLIGALLPRSARETELYGTIGDRLNAAAREAAGAAKDAGREKLADMGISRDHARDTVRNILDAALAAATSAGGAAIETARSKGGVADA